MMFCKKKGAPINEFIIAEQKFGERGANTPFNGCSNPAL
jgi:hypothetical protein